MLNIDLSLWNMDNIQLQERRFGL